MITHDVSHKTSLVTTCFGHHILSPQISTSVTSGAQRTCQSKIQPFGSENCLNQTIQVTVYYNAYSRLGVNK